LPGRAVGAPAGAVFRVSGGEVGDPGRPAAPGRPLALPPGQPAGQPQAAKTFALARSLRRRPTLLASSLRQARTYGSERTETLCQTYGIRSCVGSCVRAFIK
jgi:hypothetical protein